MPRLIFRKRLLRKRFGQTQIGLKIEEQLLEAYHVWPILFISRMKVVSMFQKNELGC